ncbi:MFS general substrate transporter [Calocera cornea HHB12733]|uniref:MFS general substrate transporter n=1 Tax=Calocera cornea HHB12733 TaxID=1353952 RepID=A0A165GBW4_9BASI|nr:MFS general substrate transporter [Calocera cornea HHB12733]
MLVYLLGYLDRANLGNGRLMGLPQDILGGDPSGQLFAWLNSSFFFAYIVFQFPGTILGKKFSQNFWLGVAATGWGFCSALQALSYNFANAFICRFGVGFFESMFSPNISLYFTFFYTRAEIGGRLGTWFACASLAGAFGGLIAYGVQHIDSRVADWRLLFIIEGFPAVIVGLLCMKVLPDRPDTMTWLSPEEKRLAVKRMNRGGKKERAHTLNLRHVWRAAKDIKVYIYGIIYFGANAQAASLNGFLPTIVQNMGYAGANAQLFTVPPYAIAAAVLIVVSFVSDKYQSRGWPMFISSMVGGTGYLLLIVDVPVHVKYFATVLVTAATYTTIGMAIAWFPYNMGSESKRAAGIPIFQGIGQCGSILGSNIYPTADAPRYLKGFGISCGFAYLAAVLALGLTMWYRWENTRRDRLYGVVDRNAAVDTSELADDAHAFRYTP